VVVVNFWTMAQPENYIFSWHKNTVRSISWLENEIGFVSADQNFTIAVWLMPRVQSGAAPNVPVWHYNCKQVNFTSMFAYKLPRDKDKDKDVNTIRISVIASGTDNFIHEICEGKLVTKYELGSTAHQIHMMAGKKALFCGINQANKPGTI